MMANHHFLSGRDSARPSVSVSLFAAQTCRSACCVFGLLLGATRGAVATVGGLRDGGARGLIAAALGAVVMRELSA